MANPTLLVNALRDADEDVRARAEQATWRIWARSGDQEVDSLYQTGVEEISAGDLRQSIATFTSVTELKPDFADSTLRSSEHYQNPDVRRNRAGST